MMSASGNCSQSEDEMSDETFSMQVGNRILDGKQLRFEQILALCICTACRWPIQVNDIRKSTLHPLFGVLICGECSKKPFREAEGYCFWSLCERGPFFECQNPSCCVKVCHACCLGNFTNEDFGLMIAPSSKWVCFSCRSNVIESHKRFAEAVMKVKDILKTRVSNLSEGLVLSRSRPRPSPLRRSLKLERVEAPARAASGDTLGETITKEEPRESSPAERREALATEVQSSSPMLTLDSVEVKKEPAARRIEKEDDPKTDDEIDRLLGSIERRKKASLVKTEPGVERPVRKEPEKRAISPFAASPEPEEDVKPLFSDLEASMTTTPQDLAPIILLSSDEDEYPDLDEDGESSSDGREEPVNSSTPKNGNSSSGDSVAMKRRALPPMPSLETDDPPGVGGKRKPEAGGKKPGASRKDTYKRIRLNSSSSDGSSAGLSPTKNNSKQTPQASSSDSEDDVVIVKKEKGFKTPEGSPKKFLKQQTIEDTFVISSDEEESLPPQSAVKTEASEPSTPSANGRKKIRSILSDSQLSVTTSKANQLERERRKRIEEMQLKYNQIESLNGSNLGNVEHCVLEYDLETKKPLVEVHPELSKCMKPHQRDGVKFLYQNLVEKASSLNSSNEGTGAILGHCMGLGKTFQVVCLLHTLMRHERLAEHFKTALVVLPLNVLVAWENEIDQWVGKNPRIEKKLTVYNLNKESNPGIRVAIMSRWNRQGGILLVTYQLLTKLIGSETQTGGRRKQKSKKFKSAPDTGLKEKMLKFICDPGPNIVLIDEGHTLKRASTQLSQAVDLIATKRKVLLTGTPLQNNLTEYFTMVSIVSPHLLGTKVEFRNRFEHPIMNGQYKNSTRNDIKNMQKRASVLNKLLEKVVHRRDLTILQSILPPRYEYVLKIRLSPLQEELYEKFMEQLTERRDESDPSTSSVRNLRRLLQDFVTLRSVWTHPKLLTMPKLKFNKPQALLSDMIRFDSITEETQAQKDSYKEYLRGKNLDDLTIGPKLFLLFDVIQRCGEIGDKVVVFCTQLSALDLIESLLRMMHERNIGSGKWIKGKDYYRMDGSTAADQRQENFKEFNNPENLRGRLFLVSTNAGKLGSTLTGANRMVLLDTSWNPADDNQAVYRIYRIGQKKPVYIYRFVSHGTMEEKIYARNILKESTSHRVLDGSNMDRHFTAEDVRDLYTFQRITESDRVTPNRPKDVMLAEMILQHKDLIVNVLEQQQLLQNLEDDLTEEEKKQSWDEYQREKEAVAQEPNPNATMSAATSSEQFVAEQYYLRVIEHSKALLRPDFTRQQKIQLASSVKKLALHTMAKFEHIRASHTRINAEYIRRGLGHLPVVGNFAIISQRAAGKAAEMSSMASEVDRFLKMTLSTPILKN